jgi:hypothetical protein
MVSSHGPSLKGYCRVIDFQYGESCLLSVPSERVAQTNQKVKNISVSTIFNVETLSNLFGSSVDRIIGPGWIGKISNARFRPCHTSDARLLMGSDWDGDLDFAILGFLGRQKTVGPNIK